MNEQTFVPALLKLKDSSVDTVMSQLHKLFSEVSEMDAANVTAAFQTVSCVAESRGMQQDMAIRHILRALHQRMVALTYEADFLSRDRVATPFCTLLKIQVKLQPPTESLAGFHI